MITSWNPAAERIYGYTAEEAIGQPVSILIPPAPRRRGATDPRRGSSPASGSTTTRPSESRKDGRQVMLSLTVSPICGRGRRDRRRLGDRPRHHRRASLARARRAPPGADRGAVAGDRTRSGRSRCCSNRRSQALGADAGAVGLVDRDSEEIELAGSIGYTEEGLAGWQRFPLDAEVPMCDAIRSNEAGLDAPPPRSSRDRFPALGDASCASPSLAVIPLAVEGRPFGAVSLSFRRRASSTPRSAPSWSRPCSRPPTRSSARACSRASAAVGRAARVPRRGQRAPRRHRSTPTRPCAGSPTSRSAVRRLVRRRAASRTTAALRNVAVAHADPEQVRARRRSCATATRSIPARTTGVPNVIRTGDSELYPEIPDELLAERRPRRGAPAR